MNFLKLVLPVAAGAVSGVALALANPTASNTAQILQSMAPSGDHPVIGGFCVLALLLLSLSAIWYIPLIFFKVGQYLDRYKLTGLWAVPAVIVVLYAIYIIITAPQNQSQPDGTGAVVGVLSILAVGLLSELYDAYPGAGTMLCRLACLGLPTGFMASVWTAGCVALLYFYMPSFIGALAIVVSLSICLTSMSYYIIRRWAPQLSSTARISSLLGHLTAAIVVLLGKDYYPYSTLALSLLVEFYFVVVCAFAWYTMIDDVQALQPEQTLSLPLQAISLGWAAGLTIVTGIVSGVFGFYIAAVILTLIGVSYTVDVWQVRKAIQ